LIYKINCRKNDNNCYDDNFKVSEYATSAMKWAVDNEFIQGTSKDILAPQGTATRAQVAAILMRFVEKTVIK